jgi:hypothetical protein
MSADTGHDQAHGSMDISAHKKTWAGFTSLVKWSMIGIILVMVFLALFRTH